jgi:lysophospholipase L1-like esterase
MRFLLAAALIVALAVAACDVRAQAARPLTYVAIGASDAVGVGVRDPETEGWVPRLGTRLGSNVRVVNLGVSGSTLSQAVLEQLGPAVDAQPDVVTVWLAVNDLNGRVPLDNYAADLETLLGKLQATHARVLVGNVPDLSALAANASRTSSPRRCRCSACFGGECRALRLKELLKSSVERPSSRRTSSTRRM